MIDFYPKKCNICGGRVVWIKSNSIYKDIDDSSYIYMCTKCYARVTTHKHNPRKAKGILADRQTRKWKVKCHKLFDSFWYTRKQRDLLYHNLARDMGIAVEDCHFGYFDLPKLQKAYDIMRGWRSNINVYS